MCVCVCVCSIYTGSFISVVSVYRDNMFRQSLIRLKEEVVKANALVREANTLAQEMRKQTEFSVTLQIPATNLTPNRKVSDY